VTLYFDNKVDSVQMYKFGECKSKAPSQPATEVPHETTDGMTITNTPTVNTGGKNSGTVTVAFNPAIKANDFVYKAGNYTAGSQTDILEFCVYAATKKSNNEVGFTEVNVQLTYTASGEFTNLNIHNLQEDATTSTFTETETFTGLAARAGPCNDPTNVTTLITQGTTQDYCIYFKNTTENDEFRMSQIVSCDFKLDTDGNGDFDGATDLTQRAIEANAPTVDELTTFSYTDSPNLCDAAANSQAECFNLQFTTILGASFFWALGDTTKPAVLECIVDVVPILDGVARRDLRHLDRRLQAPSQEKVRLDIRIGEEEEEEEDSGPNIILWGGILGGLLLLCLLLACCCCLLRRRREEEEEEKETVSETASAVTEEGKKNGVPHYIAKQPSHNTMMTNDDDDDDEVHVYQTAAV